MMNNKRRARALLAALVTGALLLVSACGASAPAAPEEESAGEETTSASVDEAGQAEAPQKSIDDVKTLENIEELERVSGLNSMCAPNDVAIMEDGSILVADSNAKEIWRAADGKKAAVFAGSETAPNIYEVPSGGYVDDKAKKSMFSNPLAIAPFMGGWVVADADNKALRLIRDGRVQTLDVRIKTGEDTGQDSGETDTETGDDASGGNDDAGRDSHDDKSDDVADKDSRKSKAKARAYESITWGRPAGLAVDEEGSLYISDAKKDRVIKITASGDTSIFAFDLHNPTGLCWKNGALYIAESGANRIVKATEDEIVIVAGSEEDGFEDGNADAALFSDPQGLAVDDYGFIYVADTANSAIRVIGEGKVKTIVAKVNSELATGPISPMGMRIFGDTLYICDEFGREVYLYPLWCIY